MDKLGYLTCGTFGARAREPSRRDARSLQVVSIETIMIINLDRV